MATMNVSLPDDLKEYVDARVSADAYTSSSEYVRALIRNDQQVQHFRTLIRESIETPITGEVDTAYFDALRSHLSARAEP